MAGAMVDVPKECDVFDHQSRLWVRNLISAECHLN